MHAADYFMIAFVIVAYATGPLLAAFLVRRINRSDLFEQEEHQGREKR
ncbi:hypothetical protein [Swaminathania salitolerans]|uniref:Uncharacterized protein n=1 Tax=Swaminathania salitolerans TaxID=182838 RepID=A0A511BQ81_9PROT|nr:hypothetical protein [Swaminathania salitolerans]GBQ11507.1 hypothetical protein AA21291_0846 [Swaminathania salitolerans LMG 21291]GEL02506.1 hypothetical protein SSA02_16690 [Swaminathania salitolerans]